MTDKDTMELFKMAGMVIAVIQSAAMLSICLWIAGYWVLSTAIQSVNSYDDRPAPGCYDWRGQQENNK